MNAALGNAGASTVATYPHITVRLYGPLRTALVITALEPNSRCTAAFAAASFATEASLAPQPLRARLAMTGSILMPKP